MTTHTEAATALAYRNSDEGLRARRAELLLQRRAEVAELPKSAARIYARRISRMAAGASLIICASLLPVTAISQRVAFGAFDARAGALTIILLAAPLVAILAWLIAGPLAAIGFRRRIARTLQPGPDLLADVESLSRRSARATADELVDGLEQQSVALPLMGIALVAPLLLHFPVWLLIRAPGDEILAGYERWILISMVLVTHSHLLLTFLAWRFARNLRRNPVRTSPSRAGWFAWLWTWASSAVPGAVLLLIPVGITLVTGLVFVPFSFWCIGNVAREERRLLEESQLAGAQVARS